MAFWFLVFWSLYLHDFLSCFFFRLAHLALQNVNKYYVIFSYLRNFIAKSDKKPKTKNGMNETYFCKKERKPRAILDNSDFFYSERAGSNVDLRVANKCFTDLGFEVHIHRNLRYIDVTNLLEQLATEIDHRQGFPTF